MRSRCPVSYSLELFGDKWSLLILRDVLFFNRKTFKDFSEAGESIATNILTARLRKLVDEGFLVKMQSDHNKKVFHFYPTKRAETLIPVFYQMASWGIRDKPSLKSKELLKLINKIGKDHDLKGGWPS